MPVVLITRPEPGAGVTAASVAMLGWEAVLAPALILKPRSIAPVRVQASLVTSKAAVPALPHGPPVLAVGEASAAAARAMGHLAMAADGDAVSLLALARARLRPEDGPLLLAVGAGYARDLATGLRLAGFTVLRRIAYAAVPAYGFPPGIASRVSAALFFSPRSAQVSLPWLVAVAPRIRAIAISPRVARALGILPWLRIDTAPRPDHDAMLETLGPPIDH